MKKLGIFLLSSMLLLMNSCSETSSPGLEWLGDEVAVRFTTTMNPSVEILPLTRAEGMIEGEVLPADEKVGIYGIRTKAGATLPAWKDATFHRQMKNKQYLVKENENHTLFPANGEVDYYPFMDSVLTVYAYAPYADTQKVDADGYLSVNLSEQIDYLVTGELLIPKDREADEVVKQLPFRHAMGAVAFRFYTDSVELDGTALKSIILTLNYNHTTLKLSLADGKFQGDFSKEEGNAYWIPFEEGTTANYSLDPTTIKPIAHTMLVPGDDFQITQLILYYQDGMSEKTLDTPITVEAGKTRVLTINCQKKAGTTPQLIVDKTGNASSELIPL